MAEVVAVHISDLARTSYLQLVAPATVASALRSLLDSSFRPVNCSRLRRRKLALDQEALERLI